MKLLVLGIDSLEPTFVRKMIEDGDSHGFVQFYEHGKVIPLRSTFPPDTVLAWPTIYTGLIHQRFGLTPEPESPLEMKVKALDVRNKIRGKTFWDLASRYGKKVCVINPIFGYPPWKVNGVMISGPSFGLKGPPLSHPPLDGIKKYRLGTYGKTPLLPNEYNQMYTEALRQMLDVFRLTKAVIDKESYDLVFVADYTLDRIQHYFWRFYDEEDPSRPLLFKAYKDYIENYYKIIDRMLANIINNYGRDYAIIVLGDHGHSRRPVKLISVEKFLNDRPSSFSIRGLTREILYLFAYYAQVDTYIYKVVRALQSRGRIGRLLLGGQSKPSNANTVETLKEFGLKEYIGIKVNLERGKEAIISTIIRKLSELEILDFIIRPEDFYGIRDVIYEADLYVKLKAFGNYLRCDSFSITPNYTKHVISGGHSLYTSFMIFPPEGDRSKIKLKAEEMRVQDVAPTLLKFLSVEEKTPRYFDGESIV